MTNAQLSLFETPPAIGTLYRAGDWVKLRRKPSGAAAWVKRGEVFRIDTVHPVDGSLRFWNPHINQWGFLYPDEVTLVSAPVDSVTTTPTISVTESIAEPDVTESIAEPDDSVTKAISTYKPKGTARGGSGEYFRFSYRDGSKVRHIHIRGGNTDSAIANARVEEVRSLLAAGTPAAEIVEMLRS
jgi:hypothetical protein